MTNNNPTFGASLINEKVASVINSSGAKVLDSVVNLIANKEIEKRATALLDAVNAANVTRSELKKIDRPDVPALLNRDGKAINEGSYSQARLKEIKKLTERLAKIEKAIEKALVEPKDATPDIPAEGDKPAVKGSPAVKPEWDGLFNLKSLIDQAEKEAAKETSSE